MAGRDQSGEGEVIATAEQTDRKPTPIEIEMVDDYLKYAPASLKIQTQTGQLVSFQFNEIQLILHEIAQDIENLTGLIRMLILKARREGVTTYWTGKFYHDTIFNRNRYSFIVTHEPDATDFVFKMVKRYYDNCLWKPTTKYNNTTLLEFNNAAGTGLDSAFRVATANKKDVGSAQLIHNLLLSEMAKYPQGTVDDILNSILQCVPKEPGTRVIMESTAKGIGGEFHDRFWGARYIYEVYLDRGKPKWKRSINPDADPNNTYARVFIPCYVFSKYQMDPEPGFKRTTSEHAVYGNEQQLASLYGVNESFLAWRRDTIVNECRGKLSTFKQEYPMNAREAFLASGRPVFTPLDRLFERIKTCPKPIAYYDCITSIGQFTAKTPQMEGETDGLLQVWEEPRPGVPYVVSADVSEGIEIGKHTDFHSVDVIEQLTGKQVAHWHGKCEPIQLGILLSHIGMRYNAAWVVPERNNHGTAVVGKLAEIKYPNLYGEETPNPPHKPILRYGWLTKGGKMGDAKALVIDNLAELVGKNADGINCPDTLREMTTYKHNADGSMGAEEGCWDDRVMSYAIGQWVRRRLLLPSALRDSSQAGPTGPAIRAGGLV